MNSVLRDIETQLDAAELRDDPYYIARVLTEIRRIVDKAKGDSRAPAEVLEALKRDVLAEVSDAPCSYDEHTKQAERIAALFDAAVKEPTTCTR